MSRRSSSHLGCPPSWGKSNQVRLEEELGARARYVLGDVPASPQGELLRDVQLSVAKYYLGNLREEVMKGMQEKAEQGGYNGRAPLGYLNDRESRSLVVDPVRAPLVRYAFERYASRVVSLTDLAEELNERGLRKLRTGSKVHASSLHVMLRNPVYCGYVRYKGTLYPGKHEALISEELFERVQKTLSRNGDEHANQEQRHRFALRDFLRCGSCGCKITAERQKGHVYYRCTKGKGKDRCNQKRYTREELLLEQVEEILARIEIGPDIIAALVEESRLLDEQAAKGNDQDERRIREAVRDMEEKSSRLLDAYLEGVVPAETYRRKEAELAEERGTFERRLRSLEDNSSDRTACVERLAQTAASARIRFKGADLEKQREILATVLSNMVLWNQEIADYQLKSPFDVLEMDDKGALRTPRWALQDLNLWPLPRQGSALPLS